MKTWTPESGKLFGVCYEGELRGTFFEKGEAEHIADKSNQSRRKSERKFQPVRIIAPDPADKARIAELEAAMRLSVSWLGLLHEARENDKEITAAELRLILRTLGNALQDAEPNSETDLEEAEG